MKLIFKVSQTRTVYNGSSQVSERLKGISVSKTDPLVTVIVPVYNAGDNIHRCIDSLRSQTRKDFVALLINDGSTDDSLSTIQAVETQYPDTFRALTQENRGVCATRHRGIYEASTKYVMFVDNDDYLDVDYIETLVAGIEATDADIFITGYRRTTEKRTLFEVHAFDDSYTPYKINAPWARIFRRDLLLHDSVRFLETNLGEDVYFNLAAYKLARSIHCLDYIGYNWYSNSESVSNTKQIGLKEDCDPFILLNALDELYSDVKDNIPLFRYFIYRYAVWYLLFSGRDATHDRFTEVYHEVFPWLKEHNYNLNLSVFDPLIRSEKFVNRLALPVMSALDKLHLMPLFALLYCKK